jgi:hypothetical protein
LWTPGDLPVGQLDPEPFEARVEAIVRTLGATQGQPAAVRSVIIPTIAAVASRVSASRAYSPRRC